MTYIPTNWQTGDIVTADKLNKIENAVASGGGVLILEPEISESTLDLNVSFNELKAAFFSGKNILAEWATENDGAVGTITYPFEITSIIMFETVPYFEISFSTKDENGDAINVSSFTVEDPDADIVLTKG